MLIVDGATSYRTVYFLSSKSTDVMLGAFKDFHCQAERQTGRKLKCVRVDMGREWANTSWNQYAKEAGIVLDFTTSYAHQQNGKAERSMQTLLDMAYTMLADSGLPQKFWADAVNTAAYTRNFIPASRSPSIIPATVWSGQHQDISHLRLFGSTAYAHIPPEVSPSKLAPCSVKLTMIGYYDRSGYKLLDCTTGAVFKSRDVIFEESRPHYSTDPIVSFPDTEIPLNPHPMVIAPRPKQTTQLHPMPPISTQPIPPPISTNSPTLAPKPGPITPQTVLNSPDNEVSDTIMPGEHEPIAIRRSRREIRPSPKMKESLEYLSRPTTSMVNTTTYDNNTIPTTFNKAMKRPNL